MVETLKNFLKIKNRAIYQTYLAIEALIQLTCKCNKINLPESYLINILNELIESSKYTGDNNNFLDDITLFYFELAKLYRDNKFSKLNFLLLDKKIFADLKDWISCNKETVYSIFNYYFQTVNLEKREKVYFDNLFFVSKVTYKKNNRNKFIAPRINTKNISIRILLSGKIYYKNGILITSNEYTISSYLAQLKSFKILSEEVTFIDITLRSGFIENFNILIPEKVLYVKSNTNLKAFEYLADPRLYHIDFFLFFELITLFLKVNTLVPEDTVSFSEMLYNKKIDINSIINSINKIIESPEKTIKEFLLQKLKITSIKLDNIFYDYYNTTFKRYIQKLKCKYIIQEYITTNSSLEKLIVKYNYSDIKNFKYNINSFFSLNVRKLNKYKKSFEQIDKNDKVLKE